MCAIIDADVAGEIFGTLPNEAARKFLEWIGSGNGRLVVGGENLRELSRDSRARKWIQEGIKAGKVYNEDSSKVDEVAEELKGNSSCKSNDEHIIALAQISNARLLYSNDRLLRRDFKDKALIDRPDGKIYPTLDREFRKRHKRLLANKNLCRI